MTSFSPLVAMFKRHHYQPFSENNNLWEQVSEKGKGAFSGCRKIQLLLKNSFGSLCKCTRTTIQDRDITLTCVCLTNGCDQVIFVGSNKTRVLAIGNVGCSAYLFEVVKKIRNEWMSEEPNEPYNTSSDIVWFLDKFFCLTEDVVARLSIFFNIPVAPNAGCH